MENERLKQTDRDGRETFGDTTYFWLVGCLRLRDPCACYNAQDRFQGDC